MQHYTFSRQYQAAQPLAFFDRHVAYCNSMQRMMFAQPCSKAHAVLSPAHEGRSAMPLHAG